MSSSQEPAVALHLGGRDVAELLRSDLAELVDAVLVSLAERIDVYASLPAEALSGDIAATVERNVLLFIESLTAGSVPDGQRLDEIRYSAARRAEERIPLEVMLRGYPLAARIVYERATASIDRDDADALREVTIQVLRFLETVMSTAAAGYLEEHQMIVGAAQSSEQRFLDALLTGAELPRHAELDHDELPDAFDVLALSIGAHPDELEPGVDAAIAARRKVRRVRSELRRRAGDHVLTSLTSHGGLALLAVDGLDAAVDYREDVEALAAAAGVPVTVAVARGRPDQVPVAVDQAREILQLVQWLRLPAALYRLDDVLVEYQVTRPGPARAALAAQLDPIARDDELVATLRAYLERGGNRRRVALDLHIHPNTVDYRMAKVHRLTGSDPTDAEDGYRLRTSLIALDAERATRSAAGSS